MYQLMLRNIASKLFFQLKIVKTDVKTIFMCVFKQHTNFGFLHVNRWVSNIQRRCCWAPFLHCKCLVHVYISFPSLIVSVMTVQPPILAFLQCLEGVPFLCSGVLQPTDYRIPCVWGCNCVDFLLFQRISWFFLRIFHHISHYQHPNTGVRIHSQFVCPFQFHLWSG